MSDPIIPYYVHDLNPVLFHIAGPLAVRWYGLAYMMGFIAAWWLLKVLARKKYIALPESEAGNFIMAIGLWGVLVGGRLGYAIFYNFHETISDPLSLVQLWKGGMASHGGVIGVSLTLIWFAKKHRVHLWNLADNIACVAPLGLMFGRLANFINGELWGRVTTVKWAMIFPTEAGIEAGTKLPPNVIQQMLDAGQLHPRHPSQLYEAFGEGLLLFLVLWLLRHTKLSQRPGVLSAAFFAIYATDRIIGEFFREPDSTIYFGWMTKGQLLSLLMYIAAAIIFAVAPRTGNFQSFEKPRA